MTYTDTQRSEEPMTREAYILEIQGSTDVAYLNDEANLITGYERKAIADGNKELASEMEGLEGMIRKKQIQLMGWKVTPLSRSESIEALNEEKSKLDREARQAIADGDIDRASQLWEYQRPLNRVKVQTDITEKVEEFSEGLKTYGFDIFLGRQRSDTGFESYIELDLNSGGGIVFPSFPQVFTTLCRNVEEGKKVLLAKSPGSVERRVRYTEHTEMDIHRLIEELGGDNVEIVTPKAKKASYVVPGANYFPLDEVDMGDLERLFEGTIEMKNLSNPFLYQPGDEE